MLNCQKTMRFSWTQALTAEILMFLQDIRKVSLAEFQILLEIQTSFPFPSP